MRNLLWLQLLFLFGCSSNEVFQTQFPIPISDYFYETKGNQTQFIIQFQAPLPKEVKLQKVYFRSQTAAIQLTSNQTAKAIFFKPDLILDSNPEKEYGNQSPTIKSRFNLKPTEAVLEFTQNGKIKHYKFLDVTEKSNN